MSESKLIALVVHCELMSAQKKRCVYQVMKRRDGSRVLPRNFLGVDILKLGVIKFNNFKFSNSPFSTHIHIYDTH